MFVTAKGQDLLTYSRSTTGTYIGSDGLLKTAAVDEARIEYDGSGNVQGLLLEPISINQWTHSTTFGGQWLHNGTLTGGQSPDPAGGSSAFLWVDADSAYDEDQLTASKSGITASGDNRWTSSIFVKKPSSAPAGTEFEQWNFFTGGTTVSLNTRWEFDSNGVISLTAKSADLFNVGYDTLANGWYRIYQTTYDTAGNNTTVHQRIYAGRRDAGYTGSLLVYGPQLEQNHLVTSYIPTSGTAGTRQNDVAYIDIDQFGVKQDRGTFVAEINNLKWFTNSPSADFPRVIEFGNTTNATDRLRLMIVKTDENKVYAGIRTDDVNQVEFTYEDYADSADVGPFSGKVALRYDETSARAAENGVLIGNEELVDDIEGQRPYRTRLALRAQANAATGEGEDVRFHIKSLKYYPRKLAGHELSLESYNGTINTTYYVTNNAEGAYVFSGLSGDNPTLNVVRGNTYAFSVTVTNHPFYLSTDNGTGWQQDQYIGEYTTGVTNSRAEDNTLFWTVDATAPNTLYYQCGQHSSMIGTINITG